MEALYMKDKKGVQGRTQKSLNHLKQNKETELLSDGMLIKRPLLITQEKIYVGFKEKEWEELLTK